MARAFHHATRPWTKFRPLADSIFTILRALFFSPQRLLDRVESLSYRQSLESPSGSESLPEIGDDYRYLYLRDCEPQYSVKTRTRSAAGFIKLEPTSTATGTRSFLKILSAAPVQFGLSLGTEHPRTQWTTLDMTQPVTQCDFVQTSVTKP